ncbi:hypothetical protein L7F22_056807 [Adiantum nelumboides]|nr:hypothetical protein [Adiantum nelumboides]
MGSASCHKRSVFCFFLPCRVASGIRAVLILRQRWEAYEQQLKKQPDLIRRLTEELNQRERNKNGEAGGEGSKKKKRKRREEDDEDDDAAKAAIKKVFKKAKLNEFDGIKKTGEDLEAWIEELEDFFALWEFSEEAKAKIAILQLRSVAKLWWKSYMHTRTNKSKVAWNEFRAQAEKRYCSPHFNMEKKMEFYGFKQCDLNKPALSVDEYKEKFLRLHKYAPKVIGDALKMKFIEGHRSNNTTANPRNQPNQPFQNRQANSVQQQRGPLPNGRNGGNGGENQRKRPTVRWQQDPEFLKRARRLGLCFRCGEQGHRTFEYPNKIIDNTVRSKMAEMNTLKDAEDNGSPLSYAWGKVREHDAFILFDPGSTHNFISHELATKLGIQDFEMGDAMKADGAFVGQDASVTPLIGKLRLHIQGYVDKEDFFISPLKHEDVILGAPWFDRLAASIKFPERRISFKFREKNMYIDAQESGNTIPLVHTHAFDKSIKSSISVYMIFVKDSLNDVNKTQVNESGSKEDLELSKFLNQFQDVFINDIPGELPPKRGDDDHAIELIPGSSPPNKPPYRVSQAQQEEIMRQVNELVEKGMGGTKVVLAVSCCCCGEVGAGGDFGNSGDLGDGGGLGEEDGCGEEGGWVGRRCCC